MLLKNRVVSRPRAKEQVKVVSQEDAWLNDVRPAAQPTPTTSSQESKSEESTSSPSLLQSKTSVGDEQAAASVEQNFIGVGHALWPLVSPISERIWQELYQRPDVVSAAEPFLAKFVQRRAIDILRAEPRIAQQVKNVAEAELVLKSIGNEVLGYGPLEVLMKDEQVSEIMVVGPRFAYVERDGKIEDVVCSFEDDRHMERIVENMLRRAGRRMQPHWPIIDVRLPDGSLVNVVMPPSAVNGPTITVLKGSRKLLSVEDLIEAGTLTTEMAEFLRTCIAARLNIVICGGVDSGRTTLLNALAAYIPANERIATIEDVAELRLNQKHVVGFVSQPTSSGAAGGTSGVTTSDLLMQALRIGTERIVLGECRGDEVVELLQAMSNGFSGVLMTMYANDLRNCLTRLEMMDLAGGATMPLTMIRTQIATTLDVIVHIARLRDGSHKVLNIAEVQNVENDVIKLQSIFYYKDASVDAATGELKRTFEPSGFCPTFLPKLEKMNITLPPQMFQNKFVI